MTRYLSILTLGALAIGVTLAAPATSHAQSFGLHLDVGRTQVDIGRGLYYGPSYYPSYSRYDYYSSGLGYGRHHHHHHGGYHTRPIVVPEYYHWTPDRGYHSHGEILIPHRGHYHVRPY